MHIVTPILILRWISTSQINSCEGNFFERTFLHGRFLNFHYWKKAAPERYSTGINVLKNAVRWYICRSKTLRKCLWRDSSLVGWRACGPRLVCSRSRDIWGWLWFLCGGTHCGGSLIAVLGKFLASIDKIFIFAGGRWALGYHSMGFRHFPMVLGRSATRETTSTHHVYK